MTDPVKPPSARHTELLELAYSYVLTEGLTGMSLRPLATAIGSSPRVLLLLFGSKDGLIKALLSRARADEVATLKDLKTKNPEAVWRWLANPTHRPVLILWAEAYIHSLVDPEGPWSGFAETTVKDWLELLTTEESTPDKTDQTLTLAILRGALLDLLATGDTKRTTAAVLQYTASGSRPGSRAHRAAARPPRPSPSTPSR